MNRFGWCVLVLALAACGKDKNNTNNGEPADTGSDMGAPEDMGSGIEDQGSGSMDAGRDEGTPDLGSDAAQDLGPDVADVFQFPDVPAQECYHPSTDPMCPMGEFGPATFLNSIVIDENKSCCRDFTGDGMPDSKIGEYAAILKGGGTDINMRIDTAIQAGELIYLLEFSNWSNDTFDAELDTTLFLGDDIDLDFSDNIAGTGLFLAHYDSYDMNGDPKWAFTTSSVTNGRLVAQGGSLELVFPDLLDQVKLQVTDVRVEADVVSPADLQSGGRVVLENGELSGVLIRDIFYASLNEASVACECLQKPVFAYNATDDEWECDLTQADSDNCMFDPTSGCRFLSDRTSCQFFQLASSDVDVDTDGDGKADGFSIGARFTGIGASITERKQP